MSRYCPKCTEVLRGEPKFCPVCGTATRDNRTLPSLTFVVGSRQDPETGEIETERVFEIIDGESED